ncbi:MAG: flavoprotein, partial [Acidobacteria bacterium]|nr:flavoprotein [Acidobacteriota bacterium]
MYLVISCSLRPASRSRILARRAHECLTTAGHEAELIDLIDHPLPLCDGDTSYDAEHV